jgi:hypothetical protein
MKTRWILLIAFAVFISPAFFPDAPPKTPEQLKTARAEMRAERSAVSAKCVTQTENVYLSDSARMRAMLKCMKDKHQEGY